MTEDEKERIRRVLAENAEAFGISIEEYAECFKDTPQIEEDILELSREVGLIPRK